MKNKGQAKHKWMFEKNMQVSNKPTNKPFYRKNAANPVAEVSTSSTTNMKANDVQLQDSSGLKKRIKLKPVHATTSAKIPEKPEDISSNWKKLLETMPPPRAVKRKMEPPYRTKKRLRIADEKTPASTSTLQQPNEKAVTEVVTTEESEEIWFDGVDEIFLQSSKTVKSENGSTILLKDNAYKGLTKYIAMDCEMVGVGLNDESTVARVSLVNQYGHAIYDKYVQPGEKVTNYRTHVSGIRPSDLTNAVELGVVQAEVVELLKGRILVGHALKHDLDVLFLNHPASDIRDTAKYKGFRALIGGATPSLRMLASQLLGISIQSGEHSSVQDAQAAMRLYTMFRQKWEEDRKQFKKTQQERKEARQLKKKESKQKKSKAET